MTDVYRQMEEQEGMVKATKTLFYSMREVHFQLTFGSKCTGNAI